MKNDLEVVDYDVQKNGFQNVANYDKSRYVGSANEYKKKVTSNAYKKLIGPLDSKLVLDVGCGTGRGLADFAGAASLVIGADASEDMLKLAASKIMGMSGVGFVRSYAQCLPFPDSCFDVVTALNFLHLFSLGTQEEMVSEMKRVVRPGGVVVLEFDNALHGVVVGPYKRWLGRERGSLPSEIRRVIGGACQVTHIYGAVFPVVWRLFHHIPGIFVPLEKIAYHPPMNRLAHRVFYRLVKCS